MDVNDSKGGSYVREKDGTLTLVSRTEEANPATSVEAVPAPTKKVIAPVTGVTDKEA